MKKQIFVSLIAFVLMSSSAHSQKDLFFADIKLAKDTLYPFDMLVFTVYLKAIQPVNARAYNKNSKLQIRMEEPSQSKWYFYEGMEGDFGGFIDDDSEAKIMISPDFLFSHSFTMEYSPDPALARQDTICPYSLMPGKYALRVIYSPDMLIRHAWDGNNVIEKCTDCVIKEVPVVVLDHYLGPDQAAYEWIKKQKYKCILFRSYYAYRAMDEIIAQGEEFLRLFPESSLVPMIHCKVGENLRKNYERNAEESKLSPAEAAQKLEAIVTHLNYYKHLKKYEPLYMYYLLMHEKYKDILLRFKARHGIK